MLGQKKRKEEAVNQRPTALTQAKPRLILWFVGNGMVEKKRSIWQAVWLVFGARVESW